MNERLIVVLSGDRGGRGVVTVTVVDRVEGHETDVMSRSWEDLGSGGMDAWCELAESLAGELGAAFSDETT